ncbi:unnamed protein product [Adineta steineri]|uniref:Uncharacterized protein n=1 Tax=Adineta steineri TaxID=433720 RepID=A0A815JGA7_9BILA|nr:unnamed protein product [Adineta steineri]
MIVSGSLGQYIVSHVHDMSQVDTIFIFCNNQEWHKQWAKEWSKIKGVYTDITSIYGALKQAAHQCEQNTISISFMASDKKVDQLDPSFMYTQILKEILLTINFKEDHFKEFITYCREAFAENEYDLQNIEKLEGHYHKQTPIWWYNYRCFLYPMLNQALRLMDIDIIVRMGFFINDLHRDIQRLHSEQFDGQQSDKTFTVYRGQGLSKEDFAKMAKTEGGLLSFNKFLSTSKNRDISLNFVQQVATNPDLVGILFVMFINPTDSTSPFASVNNVSYFHTGDEILFSMHTIFRIGNIKPMDENNDFYQVNLTLTSNSDQDLRTLNDRIRQETLPDIEEWNRLGQLPIKMSQFNKAQEIYEVLLHQTKNESDKAPIYYQLGRIKYSQGEYSEALSFYEKTLTIKQQSLPSDHPDLGDSYNRIGIVYGSMGDYPKALSYYEKALAIKQQSLPSNHPDLGDFYNNIGMVYDDMGDYPKALLSHEKALAILQQSLPSNHPNFTSLYMGIANVYYSMADYPEALSYYEKGLVIQQQSLPSNHPDLASSYMGIGNVYRSMGDYPKALSSHENALAIKQQSLPSDHPSLGASCYNIGMVYDSMSDYPKALSYYEKDLAILQQSLPSNHPDLAMSYNNIGNVYRSMGDYPEALSSHENALTIRQQILPSNHPDLATSYNSIGSVYYSMSDYSKALTYYEKALAIRQQSLPSNHPDVGASYNNIGVVYENMSDYSKADSFYERAVQNGQQSLPPNHPTLQQRTKNLENIKKKL